jgi:hypothetical protein
MNLILRSALADANTVEAILNHGEMLLVSAGSGLLATVVVILSISNAGRVLTEVALVLVRHSKAECRFWRELIGRVRHELLHWLRDE